MNTLKTTYTQDTEINLEHFLTVLDFECNTKTNLRFCILGNLKMQRINNYYY